MSKFADQLWRDLVREHGEALAYTDRPAPAQRRRVRPRMFAGSTLGLAAVGAALLMVLGGSAAPAAFAITREGDGSVLVKLNYAGGLAGANRQLAAMGIHEEIGIDMAAGPATVSGPVTCTQAKSVAGPQVKVLDGTNGTEVIAAGQSAGNTAEGTFHLVSCTVYPGNASMQTLYRDNGAHGPTVILRPKGGALHFATTGTTGGG